MLNGDPGTIPTQKSFTKKETGLLINRLAFKYRRLDNFCVRKFSHLKFKHLIFAIWLSSENFYSVHIKLGTHASNVSRQVLQCYKSW